MPIEQFSETQKGECPFQNGESHKNNNPRIDDCYGTIVGKEMSFSQGIYSEGEDQIMLTPEDEEASTCIGIKTGINIIIILYILLYYYCYIYIFSIILILLFLLCILIYYMYILLIIILYFTFFFFTGENI